MIAIPIYCVGLSLCATSFWPSESAMIAPPSCQQDVEPEVRAFFERAAVYGWLVCQETWIQLQRCRREIREFEAAGGKVMHTGEGLLLPQEDFSSRWVVECTIPPFTGTAVLLEKVIRQLDIEDLKVRAMIDSPLDGIFLTGMIDEPVRKLTLKNVTLNKASVQALIRNCNQLEELHLTCPSLTDADFSELANNGRFESLEALTIISDAASERSVETLVGKAKGLDLIHISSSDVDGGFLRVASTKLCRLNMDNCNVSDASLTLVARFPNLELLSIKGSRRITTMGTDVVQSLSSLRGLDLSKTAVSKTGLEQLALLESLDTLVLNDCVGINDDCIDVFMRFSGLSRLSVLNTNLTNDGIARLRVAIPTCTIVVTDDEAWKNPFTGTLLDLD